MNISPCSKARTALISGWVTLKERPFISTSVITDREHGVATVRFTTQQRIRQRPEPEPPRYWIATIAYEYKSVTNDRAAALYQPAWLACNELP